VSAQFGPFRFARVGVGGLQATANLALNERVHEMWAAGRQVYHLGFGESRFPLHPKVAEALRTNAQQRRYLPMLGIPELRQAVSVFYQRKFDLDILPEQVVVGPGSKALLYGLLLALGEGVLLPRPAWVTYAPQAHLVGKPVLWVPLCREDGYRLDAGLLRARIEAERAAWRNPEVLVVNSPHNPTGTMQPPEAVAALATLARQERLMILSDEIYALVAHGLVPHVSPARYYPEGTVVLGSLSKHLSLGGWRLGVAVLPPGRAGEALRQVLANIAGSVWSCAPAPVQYAALAAYADDAEIDEYVSLCAAMHAARTHYLYRRLVEAGVACAEPSGGFYVYPHFDAWRGPLADRGVTTSDDLAAFLLERYELATMPGSAFGSPPGELSLRLSSSFLDVENDEAAAGLVDAFRADSDPGRFIAGYHPQLRGAADRFARFVADLES
jgi:aspartate aminotransferase